MNFLNLIFKLIGTFVPYDSDAERETMRNEAQTEWDSINIELPLPEGSQLRMRVLYLIKKHTANWVAKMLMSIAFIVLVKVISDWKNSTPESENNNEEEIRRFQAFLDMRK